MRKLAPRYLAEFIATFFLVFLGCGAVVLATQMPQLLPSWAIPATFGVTVTVMILIFGAISGAHINPAVTVAFSVLGQFPPSQILPYILAQSLGALSASLCHLNFFLATPKQLGVTQLSPLLSVPQGLGVEILLSAQLMLVIVACSKVPKLAPYLIGLTVALCAWFGGPLTGASMNPARSLGPAIAAQNLQLIWLYTLGPIVGTILGGGAMAIFLRKFSWPKARRAVVTLQGEQGGR